MGTKKKQLYAEHIEKLKNSYRGATLGKALNQLKYKKDKDTLQYSDLGLNATHKLDIIAGGRPIFLVFTMHVSTKALEHPGSPGLPN